MNYQLTIDAFIGPWAYSKQFVRNVLSAYKGKHVDVKISSLGGNLDHGLDIRQQFIDHGDVTVYLSGFVASAATVIAMGAKRVVMSKYAMFLVHKCSNFIDAWGAYNADQMQQLIEELEKNKKENDKIDVVLANMYAAKCKKKVSDILDILKEGRWLTAQEALNFGFVDELSEPDGKESKLNFTREVKEKFNALGLPVEGLSSDGESVSTGLLDRIAAATAAALAKLKGDTPEKSNDQPIHTTTMKTYKFAKVESLLKLDSISPDADGKVTITAEQLESVNNRLESLENSVSDKTADLTAKDGEISQLKEQIENLKKSPGDDTADVKDDAAEATSVSSSDLFNSIKSCL